MEFDFESLSPVFVAFSFALISIIILGLAFTIRLWNALGDVTAVKKMLEKYIEENESKSESSNFGGSSDGS